MSLRAAVRSRELPKAPPDRFADRAGRSARRLAVGWENGRAPARSQPAAPARTSGLLGIVAQDRSFLRAIERLDRRINVEDPRLGQKRLRAKCKMPAQPRRAFLLLDRLEGPADRILADDLAHAEQLRKDSVAAQRG